MRYINKILSLFFLVALFAACSEESNMDPVGEWTITPAVLTAPSASASIVLDETAPATKTRFEWNAAVASNRFLIQYTVVLVPAGSDNYDEPILKITPGNNGKNLFAEVTAQQLDYALWAACYEAGETVALEWAVLAKAIETVEVTTQAISFTRFETEYMPETLFLTGTATEKGTDVANAIPMRHRPNSSGGSTYVFELYTSLTAGGTYQFRDQASSTSRVYGGADGALVGCGTAITAPTTGTYRITVNLNDNTYTLLPIEHWSLVGDMVQGGWGGDVPLTYLGNSVWGGTYEFFRPYDGAGGLFRANKNWGYLLKRIVGTATPDNNGGDLVMESQGASEGKSYQDIPGPDPGMYKVTLSLTADGYFYTFEEQIDNSPVNAIIGETTNPDGDAVSGSFPFGTYDIPAELYLVSDGQLVATLTKDGDTFVSGVYLALQESKKYILNSASDGSGTTYNDLGNGEISVDHDQAYQLTVDFAAGELIWKYYNLKLFHWDEVGGGWDQRQELLMTYSHPYTYTVSGSLSAGFHSKFISPWAVQFGTDATTLSGSMTNGGVNYKGIVSSGTYNATIVVADDYTTCTYEFVKQ